jgi:hypothetical protein
MTSLYEAHREGKLTPAKARELYDEYAKVWSTMANLMEVGGDWIPDGGSRTYGEVFEQFKRLLVE